MKMVCSTSRFSVLRILLHLLTGGVIAAELSLLFVAVSWLWWRSSFHQEDLPTAIVLGMLTGTPILAAAFAVIGEVFNVRLVISITAGIAGMLALPCYLAMQSFPKYGVVLWFILLGSIIAGSLCLAWRQQKQSHHCQQN
jgi:hypothetical protein